MNKKEFKNSLKAGKDALSDLFKVYDYLSDKEKDTVISLLRPVIVLAYNNRCNYYDRYFKLIPFFELKLKSHKFMKYSEFKEWHKNNINDYINSSHIDKDVLNIITSMPLKEYYEHYSRWITSKICKDYNTGNRG